MKQVFVIVSSTLLILLFTGMVFAQSSQARQHYKAGESYYAQGRYDKAIDEFKEAYRLDSKPLILFNIAQAYEKAGKLQEAVDNLKKYIKDDPNADSSVKDRIRNMEAKLAKTGIQITANEDGAVVYVDGSEVGATPITEIIKLSAGVHKIHVSKEGFEDFKMNVAISAGQTTPVEVEMEAGQSGPVPTATTPESDATETDATGDDTGAPKTAEQKSKVTALDVIPWVVAGAGAITAGIGFGAIGLPAVKNDDGDKALIGDIVGFSGVGVAAIGITWGIIHVVKKKKRAKANAVSVVPVITPETTGAFATVSF